MYSVFFFVLERDSVDWELLFGKNARHHIPVREHSRGKDWICEIIEAF